MSPGCLRKLFFQNELTKLRLLSQTAPSKYNSIFSKSLRNHRKTPRQHLRQRRLHSSLQCQSPPLWSARLGSAEAAREFRTRCTSRRPTRELKTSRTSSRLPRRTASPSSSARSSGIKSVRRTHASRRRRRVSTSTGSSRRRTKRWGSCSSPWPKDVQPMISSSWEEISLRCGASTKRGLSRHNRWTKFKGQQCRLSTT